MHSSQAPLNGRHSPVVVHTNGQCIALLQKVHMLAGHVTGRGMEWQHGGQSTGCPGQGQFGQVNAVLFRQIPITAQNEKLPLGHCCDGVRTPFSQLTFG
jgi:hypothetical protein